MPVPLIVEVGNTHVGLYRSTDGYFVYYGDYNSDLQRIGNGTVFAANLYSHSDGITYRKYYAYGEWANDMPNGSFSEHSEYVMSTGDVSMNRQGSVVNGLWAGQVKTWQSDSEVFYYPEYDNGIVHVISADGERNTIAESSEGAPMVIGSEAAASKHGILGFTD